MRYIKDLKDGNEVSEIYFCKQRTALTTKNGKDYESLILQDKTGLLDAKIWEPNSPGIGDFEAKDYVDVHGTIIIFNGKNQLNINMIRKVNSTLVKEADYMPATDKNVEEMYEELKGYISSVNNEYYRRLLEIIFQESPDFINGFKKHSAGKSVHHGFMGGLLEHTLAVTKICDFLAESYPMLNRDLIITAALCHDIGKVSELSEFPGNEYTDRGQLIGHIVIASEWIGKIAAKIDGFPTIKLTELQHCILAHHGELEFGSPKRPALAEALALSYADNIDAKMENMKEFFDSNPRADENDWLGYNKFFESNIRKTSRDNQ